MKIMPRSVVLILFSGFLYGHCQVPCGIYDDALRIVQIREDLTTIQKAMKQITAMAADESALAQNQSVRWVQTKEDHANRIQETITSYFLTQRIKPVDKGNKDYNKYVKQTLLLHQVLVSAMKCKQTLDTGHVSQIDDLLSQFIDVYFDAHGKEYLRKLSP
jgi:nickel superoxide dismutase